MSNVFNTVCDDFYVNLRVGTQMPLPTNRETLLHFFEQIQKAFPDMTRFRRHENEYAIEEDRERDTYRWMSVEPQRLSCGQVNPDTIDTSLRLHRTVLEQAPHALGLSRVEIDYIDLLLGFDLEYAGNHDEIVAETLFADSPMACLLDEEETKPVDFQPTVTVALTSDMRLQARVDVVTRSNGSQNRGGEPANGDVISVYLIVRRFFGDRLTEPLEAMLGSLADRAENLAHKHVVPKIVQPIRTAIGSRP
jgi:hypothetical protein